MRRAIAREDDRRPAIGHVTRADIERLNRLAHAKNLRSIVKCTKWLNYHGIELMRQYPQEFRKGTGMTVQQYLQALSVHVDCCRAFLEKLTLPHADLGEEPNDFAPRIVRPLAVRNR